jgi:hypothetical protein
MVAEYDAALRKQQLEREAKLKDILSRVEALPLSL